MNATESPGGELHLAKECSEYTGLAGSFCTITSSNVAAIPVGSRVVYAEAAGERGIESDLTIVTPEDEHVTGHVVLDMTTSTGTVALDWRNGCPGRAASGDGQSPSTAPSGTGTAPTASPPLPPGPRRDRLRFPTAAPRRSSPARRSPGDRRRVEPRQRGITCRQPRQGARHVHEVGGFRADEPAVARRRPDDRAGGRETSATGRYVGAVRTDDLSSQVSGTPPPCTGSWGTGTPSWRVSGSRRTTR